MYYWIASFNGYSDLRNVSSTPISTVETSVEHRLKVLELQMSGHVRKVK